MISSGFVSQNLQILQFRFGNIEFFYKSYHVAAHFLRKCAFFSGSSDTIRMMSFRCFLTSAEATSSLSRRSIHAFALNEMIHSSFTAEMPIMIPRLARRA